jgi:NAD-specific glutamate dehydrogenase
MINDNTSIHGNENIDPVDETPTSGSTLPGRHSRTGKIARLPLAIRWELNRRMREGEPGGKLLDWLNGLPEVQTILATQFQGRPIQKQNLAQWRMGGYQDSLKEEQTRQEIRSFLEEIKGLKEEAQDGLTDQLAFYMAVQAALELKRLKSAPNEREKAKLWRELSTWLVALRRGDLEMERIHLQRDKLGLGRKTKEELTAEFWKWAETNIHRDEFCRRRCYTAAEREAAINKILGITPQERGETVPEEAVPPHVDPGVTEV